ncbi:hypothetical protein FNF28_02609 [Cafeteria roenbergensis]|uniref:Fibrinogen C-terminal domain-containing protein n=1 Tax=Cafeteria roenbergensis TaxID=33653 RepID=A0A5A8DWV3_CAFRO|nr:hypothetical protein FNF28_02609 [Cafeteria roenbergensis]
MRRPQPARLAAAASALCLFFAVGAQVAAASQACQFGKLDCPGGASFCAAPVCICNPGFTGADCSTKVEEGITASAFLRSSAAAAKFRSARGSNDTAAVPAPIDVHAPEAEACMDPPVCKNGGELDKTSCTCKCPDQFGGRDCSLCSSKPCADNLSRSPKTCNCVCALAIRPTGETWAPSEQEAGLGPCRNGGKFDSTNCRCGCEGAWTGPHCEVCLPQDCAHGGVWDDALCKCRCSGPWSAEDNCATCPVKQCENGGKFDAATCSCRCPGRWKGELCDQCPAPQELAMAGISCGHRGFDRTKCDCRHECPPIDCLHGGVQDPDTCSCQCNRGNIPTQADPVAVTPIVEEAVSDNSSVAPVIVASQPEPAESASLLQAAGDWANAGAFGDASLLQAAAAQPEPAQQQQAAADAAAAPAEPEEEAGAEAAAEEPGAPAQDASEEPADAAEAADAGAETPALDAAAEAEGGAVDTDVSPAEPAAASADEADEEASERSGWVPAVPLAAAQVAVSPLSIAAFSQDTFWEGERCEVCQPPPDLQSRRTQPGRGHHGSYPFHIAPQSCPKAHTFNMTACACQPVCPPAMCQNGGMPVLLEASTPGVVGAPHEATEPHSEDAEAVIERGAFKCGCRCRPPWSGAKCTTRASGATPVSAARSCLAILRARPGAGSGRYWINPSGVAPLENAFEVFCDMNEDGGGWTEVARVGETLSTRLLDANSYTEGAAVGGGSEFVLPCGRLNGLDGGRNALRRFVLRLSMGDVRDYFRAAPSASDDGTVDLATLCEVLSSHRKHLWSPFFRRSMLDGSEALLVTAADGQRHVVFDSAPRDAPDVVVVGAANATAHAGDKFFSHTGASGEAAEEESPVIVQSLDAAQFRQLRAAGVGGRAAPERAAAATPRSAPEAADPDRAARAAASVGETSMWAWRGGVAAPPNSAEAILQNVLHGSQESGGQRFRQSGDRQKHLGHSASSSVLNPDTAADRLLTALVGAPSSSGVERPVRRQALRDASSMRFAKAHAKAGASTDWKKFSWMLPPQGFSGPYGSPQVYNQFGGPSLPGPPVGMASEASLVSPLGSAQTHVLPMSKFSAMAQDKPDVYTVDGMNLPEAHPELTPGSSPPSTQAPSSQSCAQDPECNDGGPSVVVTVSAHGSRRPAATAGQSGGQWQQERQADGQPGIQGMSPDPRLAGQERPVVTTMGQLGAAMSRGTGGPDSLYGKMLPPMNANPQPVGWRSVAPSFGGLPRFVERRGASASAPPTKLHRSSTAQPASGSSAGDPMESLRSKTPRVMSHDAQFRRQLAMGSLRPVLGSGITADDVPAWQARTAGSLAAAALLQAQATGTAASSLGLSKYKARVALHAAAFLQSGAQSGRARQEEEEEEEAQAEDGEEAPSETAGKEEGDEEAEAEASPETAETSEDAQGGAEDGEAVPAEAGVAHNPSGWVRPAYIDTVMNPQFEGLLGGSRKGWPMEIDGRMYVSFWGGNRGGCCHASSQNHGGEPDQGGWAKEFRMHVIEVDPVLFAKGDDFDFAESRAAASEPRFKDENDPMEYV